MANELNLFKYNRHWEKGFVYPFVKKRKLFKELLGFIEKRQIVEITGLRRVGKTTLFFQLINYLIKQKNINPFRILYFTFDEEKPDLDILFKNFSLQTGIDYKKEKVFVFLDEIQKLADFQDKIKIYYDLYPQLKFFLSGSSSLFLKKKKQESLAGRIFSFVLPPLDFEEYLLFKEKEEILKKPLLFWSEIEKEFETFLYSQFIESIKLKLLERKEYFVSIMRKIVFEDIPSVFPVENPELLWRLVKIIGQRPGILLNYQNLASDLGVSNKTISLYLYFLEEAFLVKKVYNFSPNLLTSERKLKKFYLASPSFSAALIDFPETGLLVENLVLSLKDLRFFWRDAYQHEVDFVKTEKEILPIEIKYQKKVSPKELKNIFLFLKKFKLKKGIVLSREEKERKIKQEERTVSIKPVFFLSTK